MQEEIFSELGSNYKKLAIYLKNNSFISQKEAVEQNFELQIAILCEKNYMKFEKSEEIIFSVNNAGLVRRLLLPNFLFLVEKLFPNKFATFKAVLYSENYDKFDCLGEELFIFKEEESKRLKTDFNEVCINYNFLDKLLYEDVLSKFFVKTLGENVSKLFNAITKRLDLKIYDELTLLKLFSQPYVTKYHGNIRIDYDLLNMHVLTNLICEILGKISGRIIKFAFEKKEFYDEEIITETLIEKNEIKLHTMRLYKLGYLQLISPEGGRIQKWKFEPLNCINSLYCDGVKCIKENFIKSKTKEEYERYFSSVLCVFFINYAYKN